MLARLQHVFSVKGHPTTPIVVASALLWSTGSSSGPGGAPGSGAGPQPVLLLAAMGDVGLSGTRVPGLVLHWTAVPSAAAPDGAAASLAAESSPPVLAVPEGWSTLPNLSWDAGSSHRPATVTQSRAACDMSDGLP
jgi:hypothetical protein